MGHVDDCIEIFKRGFDTYKTLKQEGKKVESAALQHARDYAVYIKIKKYFAILDDMLLFNIISNENYYRDITVELGDANIKDKQVKLPRKVDELYILFCKYPTAMEYIQDEIYDIINMENYEGLYLVNGINQLLYYTTVEPDFADKILCFDADATEFSARVAEIVKKMLKLYLELCKQSSG
jgi:hypothetical protein